jgi:hypothetical protein
MREFLGAIVKDAGRLIWIELFLPGGTLILLAILLARSLGPALRRSVRRLGRSRDRLRMRLPAWKPATAAPCGAALGTPRARLWIARRRIMQFICAVIAAALLVGVSPTSARQLEATDRLPAPHGFRQLSPCIAQMGVHYAREGELPLGPILGYDDGGRLIFFEYMISREEFEKGVTWMNLPGLAGHSVDHLQIDYNPHGHEGFPVPHYDIHLYLISVEAQQQVCPNGIQAEAATHVIRYAAPALDEATPLISVGAPR